MAGFQHHFFNRYQKIKFNGHKNEEDASTGSVVSLRYKNPWFAALYTAGIQVNTA